MLNSYKNMFFYRANIPDLKFDFTVFLPNLNFTGKYALKIKLLLLNIQGKGDMNGFFSKWKICLYNI